MEDWIKNFSQQLMWEPEVANADKRHPAASFIVCGMGGSHLAAGLLKIAAPRLDLLIHRDYGLPRVPDYFLRQSLIVLSSFSGNTEEVLSTAQAGLDQNLNLAVIASGGRLLALAQENGLPFVKLPDVSLPPRLALGYSLKALLALLGDKKTLGVLVALAPHLAAEGLWLAGETLAGRLGGKTPLIYSSTVNLSLAYSWKIKFNETAKIPAFCNVLPEMNHNELEGFDRGEKEDRFVALLLSDPTDGVPLIRRMEMMARILGERGVATEEIKLTGGNVWEKIFNCLSLADWTTLTLARAKGVDPGPVPLIENFKKMVAS